MLATWQERHACCSWPRMQHSWQDALHVPTLRMQTSKMSAGALIRGVLSSRNILYSNRERLSMLGMRVVAGGFGPIPLLNDNARLSYPS